MFDAPAGFRVVVSSWAQDRAALQSLQHKVFTEELGVTLARDDEPASVYALAYDLHGAPIGAGRLSRSGEIARMAVLPAWRNQGVGSQLLQTLLDVGRARGQLLIHLSAHPEAVTFYQRAGFTLDGEPFVTAGLPHQRMQHVLTPLLSPQTLPAAENASDAPPPTSVALQCSDADSLRALSIRLLDDAHYQADIYSVDLDPRVYDDGDFIDAVRRRALSGRRARLRFVLKDVSAIAHRGHRLIELFRRLDSRIHVRQVAEEDSDYASAFIVTDSHSFLFRQTASRFDAEGQTHDIGRSGQLRRYFEAVFERATAPIELRQLGL